MSQTSYLGIPLTSAADTEMHFSDWRQRIDGETDSDMMKIDAAINNLNDEVQSKQEKIVGVSGQIVGFDADGNAVAQEAPATGVTSFNGRSGVVSPVDGDYTAEMVGARPNTWVPTAADVGARSDTWMPTASDVGARSSDWMPNASDVGALPIDGGILTGALTLNGEPTEDLHAATKAFVLSAIEDAIGTALGASY